MRTRSLSLVVLVLLQALSLRGARAGAARAGRGRSSRLQDGDDALGSPGELAWQAWLSVERPPTAADDARGGAAEAEGGVEVGAARRIASRSIFVVQGSTTRRPPPPCGDGFRANTVGGCHMVIHVGAAIAPGPRSPAVGEPAEAADFTEPEGSGAPPESAVEDMAARFRAFHLHGGRTVSARRDREPLYAVVKENAQVSDYKRKSKLLRMLPTSSEQYRHMLPIIGGEQDQEIPFSQVRVRGID